MVLSALSKAQIITSEVEIGKIVIMEGIIISIRFNRTQTLAIILDTPLFMVLIISTNLTCEIGTTMGSLDI